MIKNTPPSKSERPHDDRENQEVNPGAGYDSSADSDDINAYYANQRRGTAPDLDANAPQLRSNDLQRLNRKALIFLAAIVGLLVLLAFWLLSRSGSGDEGLERREEKVVVPELPKNSGADDAVVDPMPVYSPPIVADAVPPLPIEDDPQTRPISGHVATSSEPTLLERRMKSSETGAEPSTPDPYTQAMLANLPGGNAGNSAGKEQSGNEASSAQLINRPDNLLVRGTYVRCVLETRIITDVPGFTSCIVTESIYSINGRRLLLPKGSKIFGSYDSNANGPRISVIWDRITTPNGIDVNMSSPGIDNLGGAGHPGDYNGHWGSRMSAALMISLVSDAFKYAGAKNGPTSTTVTNGIVTQEPFESNTARTMERLANQALDKSINRPATVTINQGTVINIYVARDVDFSWILASN